MHAQKGWVGEAPPAPQGLSESDILFWLEEMLKPWKKNNYAQLIQRKWTFQTGWTDSLFSKCLFWFWPFKNVSKCFFFLNNLPNLSKGNAIWNVRKRILGMLEHTNIPTIPKLFAPGHCMGVRALYSSSSSARHGDWDGMELRGLCPWHGSGGHAGAGCSGRGQSQKDPHPLPKRSPTPCRRYVWVRFWPKALCTCLLSSSCVTAETAGDSYRPQQSCFIPFCFWPHQTFLKDVCCLLSLSEITQIFTQCWDGGFFALCHCLIRKKIGEGWSGNLQDHVELLRKVLDSWGKIVT